MSRVSENQVVAGRLINGYDYQNQSWVKDGRYTCGHLEKFDDCFGCTNKGKQTGAGGESYFNGQGEDIRNEAGVHFTTGEGAR